MLETDNTKNSNWASALEIFSSISGWIVGPIIVALVAGKYLDTYFNTKPIIFIIFAVFGFLITCVGIVRVTKNYIKKLKSIDKNSEEK
jgi:F0F1-type ATP synthase assembly protein I